MLLPTIHRQMQAPTLHRVDTVTRFHRVVTRGISGAVRGFVTYFADARKSGVWSIWSVG